MNALPERERRFEDFASDGHSDILDKVEGLSDYLADHPQEYLEGLGVALKSAPGRRTQVHEHNGRDHEVVMLGSNSYLSLTTHPDVVAASKAACDKYGYGMGAVSLYAGTTDLHCELEGLIAEFYGAEAAIIFPCGYSTNVGVLSALCGPGDVVINDAHNHASIFDGCLLSGAEIKVYLHRNMRHLERILKRIPAQKKGRLIISDGVFSMHGDLAPLEEMVELARRYGARLMLDEAHAVGIVGPSGRGTAEHFGLDGEVDITIGTLSKAPGAVGGYCVGSAALIRFLRFYARTYFFSTSLPAPVVAGLIEVFKLMRRDQAGRAQLWKNIRYLRGGLQEAGFDTGESESAIVPVIVGDEEKLSRLHNDLRNRGIFTNIVTYPAVRRKECRLRLSVMNSLTREDLDQAISTLTECGRQLGII